MRKIEELYTIFKACRTVSTDTRKLIPGSVFFALKGNQFDGNQFAFDALEKGCCLAVVDDPSLTGDTRLFHVPDCLEALQELAKIHRKQLSIPVIGITGSNGKTTTKELLFATLSKKYKVLSTQGNLNNHIGVPLTLLSVSDHDIAIIEMGANHVGEIAALCKIADPDHGLITNIGKAHLEGFGSPEGVIKAKTELYDHLEKRKGTVFIDSDNPVLTHAASLRNLNLVYYGSSPSAVCSGNVTGKEGTLSVELYFQDKKKSLDINTSLVGDYNLSNILAAACIGSYFNVTIDLIGHAIGDYLPSNNRSQLLKTARNSLVMDAYNANPSSMERSIMNYIEMKTDLPRLIILGDMLELGVYSRNEHQSIVDLLEKNRITAYFLVGPEFCSLRSKNDAQCFQNVEQLIEHFRQNPVVNHSILLKGSRGIKLEKLLEVL